MLDVLFWVLFFMLLITLAVYLIYFYDRKAASPLFPSDKEPSSNNLKNQFIGVIKEWLYFTLQIISYPCRLFYDLRTYKIQDQNQSSILLIHGWFLSTQSMLPIHWKLWRNGWRNIDSAHYHPPLLKIEHLAKQVEEKLNELAALSPTGKVKIIAHSMGGLISMYGIQNRDWANKIDSLIMLGTPYHGTRLAYLALREETNGLQMQIGSKFIKELNKKPIPDNLPIYSLYSTMDEFVIPWDSAKFNSTSVRNHPFNYTGHLSLLYSKEVEKCMLDCLKDSEIMCRGNANADKH